MTVLLWVPAPDGSIKPALQRVTAAVTSRRGFRADECVTHAVPKPHAPHHDRSLLKLLVEKSARLARLATF